MYELDRFGVDWVICTTLMDMYDKTRIRTKTNGYLSVREVLTLIGLPQGDPASAINWLYTYDHIIEGLARSGLCYRIKRHGFAIYVFADDTLFMSIDPQRLQAAISICRMLIHRIDMSANVRKSAVMICGKNRIKDRLKKYLIFR